MRAARSRLNKGIPAEGYAQRVGKQGGVAEENITIKKKGVRYGEHLKETLQFEHGSQDNRPGKEVTKTEG